MPWSQPINTVALVPLKRFSTAKSRLRDVLNNSEGESLALELADGGRRSYDVSF